MKVMENMYDEVLRYVLREPFLHPYTIHDIRHLRESTTVYAYYEDDVLKGYALIFHGLRDHLSIIIDGEEGEAVSELFEYVSSRIPLKRAIIHVPIRYREIALRYVKPLSLYEAYSMYATGDMLKEPLMKLNVLFTELTDLSGYEIPEFISRRMEYLGKRFGAVMGNRIIAFGGLYVHEPEVSMVGSIWVDPEYRGRGLGKAITYYVSRKALEKSRYACLWVNVDNVPAVRAYLGVGYRIARREAWINVGVDILP